jgi:hypothetical protein
MAPASHTDQSSTRTSSVPPGLERDAQALPSVAEYLARGLDLKRWWDQVEAKGGPAQQFPLVRAFNRPTRAYGFFGEAPVAGQMMPVMGNVQEMFYDQTRGPAVGRHSTDWMRAQLEEFVQKYFMRVSSFRPPDTYADASQPIPPPALAYLSWCPRPSADRLGFGFSQLFRKKVGSASIDPFPRYDRYAIVDQRDLGRVFEWLLMRVRIFDFALTAKPFGEHGPQLVFGLNEESYLVAHEQFVRRGEHPPQTSGSFQPLADYGVGYAFVKNPAQSMFAYGPGEFDAAFETINFRIYDTGYISVRMVFVANRPSHTLRLSLDPVELSFRFADAFSLGLASRLFSPVKDAFGRLPLRIDFDPVQAYLAGANVLSDGSAARNLCISMETIEKMALIQHFRQHYQTIQGSLETWRMVKDWRDIQYLQDNFPWVVSGLSS